MIPSMSGMSTSRMTTSGSARSTCVDRLAAAAQRGHDLEPRLRTRSSGRCRPRTTTAIIDHHDTDRPLPVARTQGWTSGSDGHQDTLRAQHSATEMDDVETPDSRAAGQISPTSWNLASTISLSNGFMMYSFAPACSARAICATSFSVVQNTTFGRSPSGIRRSERRNS